MAEKPILFSDEMVRAILNGSKTQTRRVIKPPPPLDDFGNLDCGRILGPEVYHPKKKDKHGEIYPGEPIFGVYDDIGEWGAKCPYGRPGDLLWVRETWASHKSLDGTKPSEFPNAEAPLSYRADGIHQPKRGRWRPSIHMPRWASRISLKVTAVRAERVQDISEDDALAEGVSSDDPRCDLIDPPPYSYARTNFALLWDKINEGRGYSWESNPWVWVIEFALVRRLEGDGCTIGYTLRSLRPGDNDATT